jgi:hypothetical protein
MDILESTTYQWGSLSLYNYRLKTLFGASLMSNYSHREHIQYLPNFLRSLQSRDFKASATLYI